jgi:2-polyprenyl-3-methyl-5-hydroxy-6-metoxy-1,4-benzoquinol methylase
MNGKDREDQLRQSWTENAPAWVASVRTGAIASRGAGTDAAVVDAVLSRAPRRVLDVGCGEGWLARRLAESGVAVVGVDGSEPLIASAREAGGGEFHLLSYEEITSDPSRAGGGYDVVVLNFALLHREIEPLLRALSGALAPSGALVIQTLHPWSGRGEQEYRDGWREESFAALGEGYARAMPWYFRTLESWVAELGASGYRLVELREPRNPATGDPLSLLLIAAREQM